MAHPPEADGDRTRKRKQSVERRALAGREVSVIPLAIDGASRQRLEHLAAVVYSTPEKSPFFALPVGIIRRRALLQMMSAMGDAERAATWDEIETTLARFETSEGGFVGPCEMLVGSGTR